MEFRACGRSLSRMSSVTSRRRAQKSADSAANAKSGALVFPGAPEEAYDKWDTKARLLARSRRCGQGGAHMCGRRATAAPERLVRLPSDVSPPSTSRTPCRLRSVATEHARSSHPWRPIRRVSSACSLPVLGVLTLGSGSEVKIHRSCSFVHG